MKNNNLLLLLLGIGVIYLFSKASGGSDMPAASVGPVQGPPIPLQAPIQGPPIAGGATGTWAD